MEKQTKGNFMLVENVLRYLRKQTLPLTQYTIQGGEGNFFKCSDISANIGERMFRVMECDVVQIMLIIK